MKTKIYFILFLLYSSYSFAQNNWTKLDSLMNNFETKFIVKSIEKRGVDIFTLKTLEPTAVSVSEEEEIRSSVKNLLFEGSLDFAREFSLASAMAGVANNMAILDEDEANKIKALTSKSEKLFNNASDIISLFGSVASIGLLFSNEDISKGVQFSVNLAAIVPQILKAINKKRNENETIDKAIKYAHTKAMRFSIHAYLSIEMKSIAQTLDSIEHKFLFIKNTTKKDIKDDELKSIVLEYISSVERVDWFYNYDMIKLGNSISSQSKLTIYPSTLQNQLNDLSLRMSNANSLWQEARPHIFKSLDLLKTYLN